MGWGHGLGETWCSNGEHVGAPDGWALPTLPAIWVLAPGGVTRYATSDGVVRSLLTLMRWRANEAKEHAAMGPRAAVMLGWAE